MLRKQLGEGHDVRHRPVCLAGVDPVVGDEILKLSVWHPVRLPGDSSAGAEPVARFGLWHQALKESSVERGVVGHDDVTSVEEVADQAHIKSLPAELGHGEAMRGLCMRIDIAGWLAEALISPQLPESGAVPMKEKASKLHDLVVASEPRRFGINDQYLHRVTRSRSS